MKRSEMIDKLEGKLVAELSYSFTREEISDILKIIEEEGMLPPTQTCKLVPDTYRGGMKHGPCQRIWDEE